jgi:hypothetical protein
LPWRSGSPLLKSRFRSASFFVLGAQFLVEDRAAVVVAGALGGVVHAREARRAGAAAGGRPAPWRIVTAGAARGAGGGVEMAPGTSIDHLAAGLLISVNSTRPSLSTHL